MKLVMVGVLGCLAALTVGAQTLTLRAKVPFEFSVAEQKYTAGDVMIQYDARFQRLTLMAGDRQAVVFLLNTIKDEKSAGVSTASLVFHKYGDEYFLRTVDSGIGDQRWDVGPSKAERTTLKRTPFEVARLHLSAK